MSRRECYLSQRDCDARPPGEDSTLARCRCCSCGLPMAARSYEREGHRLRKLGRGRSHFFHPQRQRECEYETLPQDALALAALLCLRLPIPNPPHGIRR